RIAHAAYLNPRAAVRHTLLTARERHPVKLLGTSMTRTNFRAIATSLLLLLFASVVSAQSGATRPRRVLPNSVPQPTPTPARVGTQSSAPLPTGDTAHAFALLQQGQNEAAAREAKQIAAANPNNAEAWKIAGFAEYNLKQYAVAATDLQRALDLQRKGGAEEVETADALARSYARAEQFDRALPLLVA